MDYEPTALPTELSRISVLASGCQGSNLVFLIPEIRRLAVPHPDMDITGSAPAASAIRLLTMPGAPHGLWAHLASCQRLYTRSTGSATLNRSRRPGTSTPWPAAQTPRSGVVLLLADHAVVDRVLLAGVVMVRPGVVRVATQAAGVTRDVGEDLEQSSWIDVDGGGEHWVTRSFPFELSWHVRPVVIGR